MLQRRIIVLSLVGTAGLGVLAGGVAGVLGGGSSGSHAHTAASASAPSSTAQTPLAAGVSGSTAPTPSATPSASATASPSASPSTPPPMANGRTYKLAVGAMVMDVNGRDKKGGAAVILYSASAGDAGGPNEQWTVRSAGGPLVYLQSVNSGMCLSAGDGGRAVQAPCGKGGQQVWKAVTTGAGPGFTLQTQNGQKALGPSGTVGGNQGLGLVAPGAASQWQAVPA